MQPAIPEAISRVLTETEKRQHDKLSRELGPLVLNALADPLTIEVMLNPDSRLWVERLGETMKCIGTMSASSAIGAMGTIAACLDTVVTRENPILEGELPLDGSRFEGLIPPIVARPSFAIRKKAIKVFTLDQYVEAGALTRNQRRRIAQAVLKRENILVVGGTSTGKTTLLNAIIDEIRVLTAEHRLIIIEDTGEIQCTADNVLVMRANKDVSMLDLLKATLRLRPDRILIGEVRGAEALSLLKSWNTGHPGGLASLHANDPQAGLIRLEQLISEATAAPMQSLIGEAVDLVIHIEKTATGRKVTGMLEVLSFTDGKYVTREVNTENQPTHEGSISNATA